MGGSLISSIGSLLASTYPLVVSHDRPLNVGCSRVAYYLDNIGKVSGDGRLPAVAVFTLE